MKLINQFLIALGLIIQLSCQKNEENNNSEERTLSGTTHSCGVKNIHNPNKTYRTVKDIDGNTYRTIQIGKQIWMAENLNTSKYRNGISIPNITNNTEWSNSSSGVYSSVNNNEANDCPYGKLYNWYAVNDINNLCPSGWHVPTDAEWTIMITYLDSTNKISEDGIQSISAGGIMKSTGTEFWIDPNKGATNGVGFAGLPAGFRTAQRGVFSSLKNTGYWWSSTENNTITDFAWLRSVNYNNETLNRFNTDKKNGFSVRCIKD